MTEQLALAEARTRSGRKSRRNLGTTEDDLLRSVRKLCRYTGYLCYHTLWSKGSEPGFPDLVLASAKRQRLIFAELKAETGKPTAAQQLWLDTLTATGNEAYLWRPADLTDGTILATLTSRRIPETTP